MDDIPAQQTKLAEGWRGFGMEIREGTIWSSFWTQEVKVEKNQIEKNAKTPSSSTLVSSVDLSKVFFYTDVK